MVGRYLTLQKSLRRVSTVLVWGIFAIVSTEARATGSCLSESEARAEGASAQYCGTQPLCLYPATTAGLRAHTSASSGDYCAVGQIPYTCASNGRCRSGSTAATADRLVNPNAFILGDEDQSIISTSAGGVHDRNGLNPCPELSVSGRQIYAPTQGCVAGRSAFYACPSDERGRSCSQVTVGGTRATYAELAQAHTGAINGRPVTVNGGTEVWGSPTGTTDRSPPTETLAAAMDRINQAGGEGPAAPPAAGREGDESEGAGGQQHAAEPPARPRITVNNGGGESSSSTASLAADGSGRARAATGQYINEEYATSDRDDPCRRSTELLSNSGATRDSASCSATKSLVSGARITEQAGQMVGSMSVGVTGAAVQSRAMSEQSQTAALEGAKKMASTTASINGVMGATSLLMATAQLAKMGRHNRAATTIKGAGGETPFKVAADPNNPNNFNITTDQTSGNQGMKNFIHERVLDTGAIESDLNSGASADGVQSRLNSQTKRFLSSTSSEQTRVAEEASVGGVMSLTSGVRSMMQMGQNIAQARSLQKQIDGLKNLPTGNVLLPVMEESGDQGAVAPGGGGSILGGGEVTGAASTEGQEDELADDDTSTDLGDPLNTGDGNLNAPGAAPVAGAFTPGSAQAGGGSGGGGMGGGANGTSDSRAATEGETGPKMAGDGKLKAGYGDAAAGGYRGGSSGGGSGGNDAIAMPDLSALLAQFQPKEGDLANKNGIMDYGGRAPAAGDTGSFLDKNANIFERIGNTYRDAAQHGRVVAR